MSEELNTVELVEGVQRPGTLMEFEFRALTFLQTRVFTFCVEASFSNGRLLSLGPPLQEKKEGREGGPNEVA